MQKLRTQVDEQVAKQAALQQSQKEQEISSQLVEQQ